MDYLLASPALLVTMGTSSRGTCSFDRNPACSISLASELIYADPYLKPLILGNGRVALREALLQRHGAFDGVHVAGELSQQTVAQEFEYMAVVAQFRVRTVPCGLL